ncbi:MAG TPA: SurA N-terminal domain-containing protein [Patescibacteria group bacterium]|nr:SurA N-terminal domain-containing protein [Patescibacteria group bacterium]
MKRPKLKKPTLKLPRRRGKREPEAPAAEGVPRITNETIAEHREEIIGSARKYIYPLQHSKHRIILITTGLLVASIITFFAYCTLALYRFQSTSGFIYRVTQVVPFPVARAGNSFVSYESYLFEVRHYTHYYQTQLKVDFNSTEGKQQLEAFKKQALDKVINDAYIKKLADKYHVTVSDQQINDQITILRNQNRLGNSDKVFEDVLRDYWGWSVDDFKRSLRDQLLAQNLAAALDTNTQKRADQALGELKSGADFGAVAKKYSDDVGSKDNGGDIGVIERTKRDLTAQTVDGLYKLKPGQYSDVINIGYSLEIVKNIENTSDGRIHAAHILFNFKDSSSYLNDLKDQQKAKAYVKP